MTTHTLEESPPSSIAPVVAMLDVCGSILLRLIVLILKTTWGLLSKESTPAACLLQLEGTLMSVLGYIVMATTVSCERYSCDRLSTVKYALLVDSAVVAIHIPAFITGAPNVTSFQRVNATTNFTLNCTSTNSPATNVTWLRNGNILQTNGGKNQFYQTVTSRQKSIYQNVLVVDDNIENVIGNYTCNVTNKLGNSNSTLTIRGKMAC